MSRAGPRLSVCTGMLDVLPLEDVFALVRNAGLDAVELLGEPRAYDADWLERALRDYGLGVTGLTAAGRLPSGRDIAHPDAAIRDLTVQHFLECLELAAQLEAPFVAVPPSAVGRHWLEADREVEWGWAVDALAYLAGEAAARGIMLGIEILNRYATPTVHSVEEALRMIDDAGGGPIGIVIDLFHAAIEERSVPEAIRTAGDRLVNVQVADNTREGPGHGSIDFHAIAQALADIDYRGSLALEAFPRGCGAFPTLTGNRLEEATAYLAELRPFFAALPIDVSPVP